MSDTRPTPETDKLQDFMPVGTVWLEHSRSLERERDEARAALSGRTVSCSQCNESAKRADSKHGLWMAELRKVTELEAQIEAMRELLREIRDDEVNAQDEADKFLRDHEPSELSKMREAIRFTLANHNIDPESCIDKLKPFLP